MPRYYLRFIVIPLLIFTVALLLIHAQPYDDHELRDLLLPERCPPPCFIGIRPGVTRLDEALEILNASGWVESYDYQPNAISMTIKWNTYRPAWLDNSDSYLSIADGLVTEVNLTTTLTLDEIQLGMREPIFQQISLNDFGNHWYLYYSGFYTDAGLKIMLSRDCELGSGNIADLDSVHLNYAQMNTQTGFPPNYRRSWIYVMHAACP